MAQELYKLPDGWEWKAFNDVCINITDGAHASPKTVDEGFPYVTVRDVDHKGRIDTVNCKRISKEDFLALKKANCQPPANSLLLSKDGTVGKVAHVSSEYEEFVVLSSLAIITPNQKVLEPEYLKYFLLSPEFQDHAIGSKTGAAIKRIVLRTIKGFKIPLVQVEIQKRIVKKLDILISRIDTAIEHLENSLELNDQLFASSLNQAFNPLDAELQSDGTYQLPEGWEWKTFKEICVLKRGYDLPTRLREEGTYPLYSANGVTDYINQYKVSGPGVITGRSGTIGKVSFTNEDFWPLNTALYVQDFNGNHPKLIKYFLQNFNLERFSSGAAVPTLNRNSLSDELACVPVCLEEQKVLSDKLDEIKSKTQANKQVLQQKLEQLQQLKASLLDSAFRGEL